MESIFKDITAAELHEELAAQALIIKEALVVIEEVTAELKLRE